MYVRIPHATLDPRWLISEGPLRAQGPGAISIQSSDAPFCFPIMIREPSTASTKKVFLHFAEKEKKKHHADFSSSLRRAPWLYVPRKSDRCSLKRYGSPILNSLVLIPPFPHPFHDLESHPSLHGFIQIVASRHLDCDESYVL